VNLGRIVSGDWLDPFVEGDAILMDGGRIAQVGQLADSDLQSCDVVIDAARATAIPGLIDSQVHNTFGDYTPRQKTVGFLETTSGARALDDRHHRHPGDAGRSHRRRRRHVRRRLQTWDVLH